MMIVPNGRVTLRKSEMIPARCRRVRVLVSVNDVMSFSCRVAGTSAVPALAAMSSVGKVTRPNGVPRLARPWKCPVHAGGGNDLEALAGFHLPPRRPHCVCTAPRFRTLYRRIWHPSPKLPRPLSTLLSRIR